MPHPRLRRALRAFLYTVATLFLLYATLIAGPMWLTRIRISHLLADFQSVRPTQSTWADAQRLMTRWGKWGHYEGTCSEKSCNYDIDLMDPISALLIRSRQRLFDSLDSLHVVSGAEHVGWRQSRLQLDFLVKNGIITSTRTNLGIAVPHYAVGQWDAGYTLMLSTQVRPRLQEGPHRYRNEHWILGNNEQLADHPDYKIGRPSGCEGCESYEVTYTPALSQSEVIRLTSYDLSCLTRWHPCIELIGLLPVARQWDFYKPPDNDHLRLTACHTDPRALARDAEVILEVESLMVEKATGTTNYSFPGEPYEIATTRIVRVLKGTMNVHIGSEQKVIPFPGIADIELPEHLDSGRRYFLLLSDDETEPAPYDARRCDVLEVTPENLSRLSEGIDEDLKYHDIDNPDD